MKIIRSITVVLAALAVVLVACSASTVNVAEQKSLVLVAGATGGTGRAMVRNLLGQGYAVRAFARDAAKARVVLGDDIEYAEGDVRDIETINAAMLNVRFVISSIGGSRDDPTNGPEFVDFGGVKNLAQAAAAADVEHFVLVSSSGVTHEDHFLNKIMNNVLNWKFAGEQALRESGVPYTIVRPGGLVTKPGGIDTLVFAQGDSTAGTINREDVALICIAALSNPEALNRTFETFSSKSPGANDWQAMFDGLAAD
jgi:uncharacterized protein YbjT (DUF2867 family)